MAPPKRNAALEALGGVPKAIEAPVPLAAEPEEAPAPAKPAKDVAKVMLYLHPKVARKFKEIAFTEDRKAHDVYLEALDAYLTAQGHGGLKGVSGR
ncbi:MAG: hypothetical protein EKK49_19695 [Rhodocyclaceae bacterium]|jgi:hypothetical protein|uniref:hypothetical protein n=1 Tax=Methylobacterium sp. TaxID=409 RepID=UPI000FAECEC3|nr:hypothetical protein [Methylobacterium sp.]RTL25622.1 MAG: hypothetical protein EKK49_19695 [Rhodocyclaceae bacterium]RUP17421.1 MAG: hypothetical protein EKK44_29255 [Methylobacterium sp.]